MAARGPDYFEEDVALGYKNLLEAERGFRDLKSTLERTATRLSPRAAAHPRARPALLAGAAADPRRRTPDRPDLATHRAGHCACTS